MNLFKSLLGLKYITFGFVFIIAIFSFSHQAFATYSYPCADGGNVNSTVTINPVGPFQVSSQTQTFKATGQIYSTCSTRRMRLKANNNGGAWTDIIPDDPNNPVYPNAFYPTYPAEHFFIVPSTEGTYNVAFVTEQNEDISGYSSISCTTAGHGTHSGQNAYYLYPDMIYDNGTKTGPVTFNYYVNDIPNRFSIWTFAGNQLLGGSGNPTSLNYNSSIPSIFSSQGWKGYAKYIGQWGAASDSNPYSTYPTGSFSFTPIAGQRYYRVRVETEIGPGASTDSQMGNSDAWDLSITCP